MYSLGYCCFGVQYLCKKADEFIHFILVAYLYFSHQSPYCSIVLLYWSEFKSFMDRLCRLKMCSCTVNCNVCYYMLNRTFSHVLFAVNTFCWWLKKPQFSVAVTVKNSHVLALPLTHNTSMDILWLGFMLACFIQGYSVGSICASHKLHGCINVQNKCKDNVIWLF